MKKYQELKILMHLLYVHTKHDDSLFLYAQVGDI